MRAGDHSVLLRAVAPFKINVQTAPSSIALRHNAQGLIFFVRHPGGQAGQFWLRPAPAAASR